MFLFQKRSTGIDTQHLIDRVPEEKTAIQGGDLRLRQRKNLAIKISQGLHRGSFPVGPDMLISIQASST